MHLSTNLFSVSESSNVDDFRRLLEMIEAAGYDEIDFGDHVTIGLPTPSRPATGQVAAAMLEPLTAIAAAAVITRRVRLGTGILVLPQRQPAVVAKQVTTLDILSGGRIRLGVGVGWQASEFESLGVPFNERGPRIEECIELLRLYWRESPVSYRGRFYEADTMSIVPRPVQSGGPPIWLGGSSETAIKRVGRMADGWMAVGEEPETVHPKVELIRAAAEEAGRDPSDVGLQVLFTGVPDAEAIAEQAARFRAEGFTWCSIDVSRLLPSGTSDLGAVEAVLLRIKELIDRETA